MTRIEAIQALRDQGWDMAQSGVFSGYIIWRGSGRFNFGSRSFRGRGNRERRVSLITFSTIGWGDLVQKMKDYNKVEVSQ